MADDILKRGLTPTHELMGDWMLQNPGGTLRQMGAHFGYSISWLSQVMNTDLFKAYMAGRLKEVHCNVNADIPAKLRALADLSIERMIEKLETTEDTKVILESFDSIMHRYGFAPNAKNGAQAQVQVNNQQNNFYLSRDDFQQAHEKLVHSHEQQPPAAPALEHKEPGPVNTPEKV